MSCTLFCPKRKRCGSTIGMMRATREGEGAPRDTRNGGGCFPGNIKADGGVCVIAMDSGTWPLYGGGVAVCRKQVCFASGFWFGGRRHRAGYSKHGGAASVFCGENGVGFLFLVMAIVSCLLLHVFTPFWTSASLTSLSPVPASVAIAAPGRHRGTREVEHALRGGAACPSAQDSRYPGEHQTGGSRCPCPQPVFLLTCVH